MAISVDKLSDPKYRNWAKKNECVLGALFTIDLLRGKWKLFLLHQLSCGTKRYSELRSQCHKISESVLARKLGELQTAGLVDKKIYPEIPPHTDYSLTTKGEALVKLINDLEAFGEQHIEEVQELKDQLDTNQ